MKKRTMLLLCLMLAASLVLAGCGGAQKEETVPQLQEGEALELTGWTMNATAWSSPNGATVNVDAVPNGYMEGQKAEFCVRLEGEEIVKVPCEWDGKSYKASADLNAADGYCYYAILTAADGETLEVALNTPKAITDEALINMETALNSYCTLLVESSESADGKLTITGGTASIQPPRITNNGEAVTCTQATLVLSFNGDEIAMTSLLLPEAQQTGLYELNLAGTGFDIPAMEDDQQLSLRLDVTLSNGQTLTDANGTWIYMDGQLLSAVG